MVGVCEECPPSNCCSHSAQCNAPICVRNCVANCYMELLRRANYCVGRSRTLRDLPQIVLAAYFLKRSFGDCLVANKSVPVGEIMSVVQNCQLTENAAFMVVMSLMTSAVYLGCAHRPHHLWSFRPETKLLPLPRPQRFNGCVFVQTRSCKSRASSTFGAREKSWRTGACSGKSCSNRQPVSTRPTPTPDLVSFRSWNFRVLALSNASSCC